MLCRAKAEDRNGSTKRKDERVRLAAAAAFLLHCWAPRQDPQASLGFHSLPPTCRHNGCRRPTHCITAARRGGAASPSAAAATDVAAAEGGAADDPAVAAPATESLVRCRFVLERLPGQARIPRTQGDRCLKVATCLQTVGLEVARANGMAGAELFGARFLVSTWLSSCRMHVTRFSPGGDEEE